MVIDHIGIAVKDVEAGIKHWENIFGYSQLTEVVENSRQKVFVVFLHKDNSLPVKLIQPTDETSPLYTVAQRGGGLHHLCFKCDSVNETLSGLREKGVRVLADPQPGEAFENESIAFFYDKKGLNVELIDTDKRALEING